MSGRVIYPIAALVSLLLSYWIGIRETVINPDAICYLQSAEMIGSAGLQSAMHLCDQSSWPFYSILIFSVVKLTHVPYVGAAYVLDGMFSLISVMTFIYLVQLLGGSRRTLWFAAVVILLAHDFNSVREYIIRDHGFWAFYLLSVALLVQYFRRPQWRYALLWSATSIVATLFRVEGVIFLLVMPFAAWFLADRTVSQRIRLYFRLNVITLLSCILLLGWLVAERNTLQLSRLQEVQLQLTHGLTLMTQHFHASSTAMAQYVLSPFAANQASWVLGLTIFVWFSLSIISSISLVFGALIVYAWLRKLLSLDQPARVVVWGCVIINLMVTAIFLAENMFIDKRYLIALSLMLILWVPFALERIAQPSKQHQWVFPAVIVLVILNSLGGIFDFGYSKKYIHDAGSWLAENIPADALLYSNDEQVMYYSKHFGNAIFSKSRQFSDKATISDANWKQFDYLALRQNKHNITVPAELNYPPLQVFANKRGDEVVIYKILK